MSRGGWNGSRDGGSITPLGCPFQCCVIPTVNPFPLLFGCNMLCPRLCPSPLVLFLGSTGKEWPKAKAPAKSCGTQQLLQAPWCRCCPLADTEQEKPAGPL